MQEESENREFQPAARVYEVFVSAPVRKCSRKIDLTQSRREESKNREIPGLSTGACVKAKGEFATKRTPTEQGFRDFTGPCQASSMGARSLFLRELRGSA
jgi:hypothetical protein